MAGLGQLSTDLAWCHAFRLEVTLQRFAKIGRIRY